MLKFTMKPLAVAVAFAVPIAAHSQQSDIDPQTPHDGPMEEVIITGSFASSLADALNAKRTAVNARESIMAEDMGKMPDLNLAESMQRVPGVAIAREGGEGRQITIRGLGPEFTRTTLNGMEVPASTDGLDSSGGLNQSRAFDFNVFASEMFNRIDIHKTPTASVEEGGIAGTVELYTGKPFDMPGFNASVSAQAAYNDLGGNVDPRLAAMVSNTFADDTFGVLASLAYTDRTVRQEGYGSVRYTTAFVNDQSWADTSQIDPEVVNQINRDAACPSVEDGGPEDPVDCLWNPRQPRMDYFANDQSRLGATAAFQWRPSAGLELGLDLVHSTLENGRVSHNTAGQFRNLYNGITPVDITLNEAGTAILAGTFDGVIPRSENKRHYSETNFNQVVVNGSFDITDNMTVTGLVGNAASEFAVDVANINISFSEPTRMAYSYEANPNIAEMWFGEDRELSSQTISDPANFEFSGPNFDLEQVNRDNTTARVDLDIRGDNSSVKLGVIFNQREVENLVSQALPQAEPTAQEFITDLPVDDFADTLEGVPANFPRNWAVLDLDRTVEAYDLGPWEPVPLDEWLVEEKTTGAYAEFTTEAMLLDMPLYVNAGMRVVETKTTGTAYLDQGGTPVEIQEDNSYTNVLPSTNITWELRDDLQLRFSAARSLSRAGLAQLAPSTTYSGPNGTVSTGNTQLDPILSDSTDVSVEWYFMEDALLATTVFYKDINSFIATDTVIRDLEPSLEEVIRNDPGLIPTWAPFNVPWEYSEPVNNDGAELTGVEFIYQQPFTFLPGSGVSFNYMVVESTSEYGTGDRQVTADLVGMSDTTMNITLYYETDVYGARISANERSDYLTRVPGRNGNGAEATTGPRRVDASAFYNVTDNVTLTLEAVNLTNEPERLYTTGYDNNQDFVREYNSTGRQFFLGVRANF